MSAADRSPQPGWLSPVVVGDRPLRPPEAGLAAVQTARTDRGYTADGQDHPRGRWWLSAVLPAGVIDAAATIAWAGTGSAVAATVAAVASAAVVGLGTWIARDPWRINPTRRRQLDRAKVWRSGNEWIPPLTDSPDRARLARAQQAVTNIVATRCWWQETMSQARSALDLVVELDEIDAQAFRLAVLGRSGQDRGQVRTEDRAELQDLLERRVAALVALAGELESQDRRDAVGVPASEPTGDAIVGGVLDEFATRRLLELTQQVRETGRPDRESGRQ